jgi:hypothetical protein
MALKRFSKSSLSDTSVVQLPSKNPIISYVEYAGGKTYASSAGGETVIVHGYNFRTGASIYLDNTPITSTVLDGTRISFITTVDHVAARSRDLYVINTDGTGALYPPRFQIISAGPVWVTPSGNLGNITEYLNSFTLQASSDSIVTYTLISGQVPIGYALTPSTGIVSGSHNIPIQVVTVYSFTIRATDEEGQYNDRDFTITFIPTFPTWITDATLLEGRIGQYYTTRVIAISNSVLQYQLVTALPAGLTLNNLSGVISGTPTAASNVPFTVNAVDNENNTTAKTFVIVVT